MNKDEFDFYDKLMKRYHKDFGENADEPSEALSPIFLGDGLGVKLINNYRTLAIYRISKSGRLFLMQGGE